MAHRVGSWLVACLALAHADQLQRRAVHRPVLHDVHARPVLQAASDSTGSSAPPPDRVIQATTFTFVLSTSLVALTPAPHVIKKLGRDRGMALLIAVSTAGAIAEIAMSPLIGGLCDSVGRRAVIIGTLASCFLATVATALCPRVELIAAHKLVCSITVGTFFLGIGAVLADVYRAEPKKLAGVSGVTFALLNLGFGIGVALSSRLPTDLRWRYAVAASVSATALTIALVGVPETLPKRLPFQVKSFNPFSFVRLLCGSGRAMRLLTCLAALTLAPLFMGDTLQVFAQAQWGFSEAQVSMLFTLVAISGVVANSCSGILISRFGLQAFTAIATFSSLVFCEWRSRRQPRPNPAAELDPLKATQDYSPTTGSLARHLLAKY